MYRAKKMTLTVTSWLDADRNCDFCLQSGKKKLASYDGSTRLGPWALMCERHFKVYGRGLGTGKGQRLMS